MHLNLSGNTDVSEGSGFGVRRVSGVFMSVCGLLKKKKKNLLNRFELPGFARRMCFIKLASGRSGSEPKILISPPPPKSDYYLGRDGCLAFLEEGVFRPAKNQRGDR